MNYVVKTSIDLIPNGECVTSKIIYDDKQIGISKIMLTNGKQCTISAWYVDKEHQNQGLGRLMIKKSMDKIINERFVPEKITYIWNGVNQYVHDWLVDNFDAKCQCPIEYLKNNSEDSWLCHVYKLDTVKFIEYFLKYDTEFK